MDKPLTGSNYTDADVKCPFYKISAPRAIVCEGAEEKQTITVRSRSGSKHRKFMDRYCESDYVNCPYYRVANRKYETGD